MDAEEKRRKRKRPKRSPGRRTTAAKFAEAGPDGKEPPLPGATPRCEFGVEALIVLAFLIYVIRMSFSKAGKFLQFFCELPIQKSQADALLRQLAKHWQSEFETISALIAFAVMVHMDETGWRVGDAKCSLWVFASHRQRLYLFRCRKDEATLEEILPSGVFKGIGVSDDASVYRDCLLKRDNSSLPDPMASP